MVNSVFNLSQSSNLSFTDLQLVCSSKSCQLVFDSQIATRLPLKKTDFLPDHFLHRFFTAYFARNMDDSVKQWAGKIVAK